MSLLSKRWSWLVFVCTHRLFLGPAPLKLLMLCSLVWEKGHKVSSIPGAAEALGWVPRRWVKLSRLFIHFTFSFDFRNLHIYISVSYCRAESDARAGNVWLYLTPAEEYLACTAGASAWLNAAAMWRFYTELLSVAEQWQSAPADPESAQPNNKWTLRSFLPPDSGAGEILLISSQTIIFLLMRSFSVPFAAICLIWRLSAPARRSVAKEATRLASNDLQRAHLT